MNCWFELKSRCAHAQRKTGDAVELMSRHVELTARESSRATVHSARPSAHCIQSWRSSMYRRSVHRRRSCYRRPCDQPKHLQTLRQLRGRRQAMNLRSGALPWAARALLP